MVLGCGRGLATAAQAALSRPAMRGMRAAPATPEARRCAAPAGCLCASAAQWASVSRPSVILTPIGRRLPLAAKCPRAKWQQLAKWRPSGRRSSLTRRPTGHLRQCASAPPTSRTQSAAFSCDARASGSPARTSYCCGTARALLTHTKAQRTSAFARRPSARGRQIPKNPPQRTSAILGQ